jgi:hypothetical protein
MLPSLLLPVFFASLCLAGPSSYGSFLDFPAKTSNPDNWTIAPIYPLGQVVTLRWTTILPSYNVTLWQQSMLTNSATSSSSPIFCEWCFCRNLETSEHGDISSSSKRARGRGNHVLSMGRANQRFRSRCLTRLLHQLWQPDGRRRLHKRLLQYQ